jgi:pre-mRNA-splicing factor ATP-dependent RNA helicase DHX16
MDSGLFTWVNDKLIKITGISEDTIVDFVIACAKSSKSSDDLLQVLYRDVQLPKSEQAQTFAIELFSKFPKKKSKKIDKNLDAKRLLVQNSKFQILQEIDDFDDMKIVVVAQKEVKPKREREREEQIVIKGKKMRQSDKSSKANAWDVLDAEEDFGSDPGDPDYDSDRERDLKERDEFSQRLKEKDMEKELVISWIST